MNKKKLWLVMLLAMGGCASQPASLGPLPYDFRVVRVEDARPDDDAKLMSAEPFGAEKLIGAWHRQVARSVWGGTSADLAIRVTQFEATHSGQSYALSLVADLAATQPGVGPSYRNEGRRVVAQAPAQCMAVARSTGGEGGSALANRVKNGVFGAAAPQSGAEGAPGGLAALTPAGRDATLWQELWNQCARQLATQFTQALLAGAPQAVPDTRGR